MLVSFFIPPALYYSLLTEFDTMSHFMVQYRLVKIPLDIRLVMVIIKVSLFNE